MALYDFQGKNVIELSLEKACMCDRILKWATQRCSVVAF